MNRSKKLLILVGVLLAGCAATFGVLQYQEKQEQIKNSGETILAIPTDTVTALSWEYEDTALAFHKGDRWLYDEDEAFPGSEDAINTQLAQFENFAAAFIIEDVEDYGQYGLDKPICTIHLTADETEYTISLGNYSNLDSQRYVDIGDGNVYLMVNDPLDVFDTTIREMIEHDAIPAALKDAATIQFAGAENYSIVYEEDSPNTYCADDVFFAQQEGKSLPLDTSKVNSYLSTITGLNPTNYVTYNATEEEIRSYGLDDPELTIVVKYTTKDENKQNVEESFTLYVSRDPEKVAEADEDDELAGYVRVGESKVIYEVSSSNYKKLMAVAYDDLRHRLVFSGSFEDVTQVDVSLEGATYTLTSEEKDDERTFFYQEEELEIDDFESALRLLTADSFTSEKPTQKKEIELIVHLDNENYPQVKIELYRYDGSNCLAVVDGESVSLVPRSEVVELIEAVNAIILN